MNGRADVVWSAEGMAWLHLNRALMLHWEALQLKRMWMGILQRGQGLGGATCQLRSVRSSRSRSAQQEQGLNML